MTLLVMHITKHTLFGKNDTAECFRQKNSTKDSIKEIRQKIQMKNSVEGFRQTM